MRTPKRPIIVPTWAILSAGALTTLVISRHQAQATAFMSGFMVMGGLGLVNFYKEVRWGERVIEAGMLVQEGESASPMIEARMI